MTSITYFPVSIQASADSVPSLPCWFGEVTLLAQHLHRQGVLAAIEEQVRFARRRFGRVRGDRFCRSAFRLCHQRRTHAGSLLRAALSLGCCLHGTLRSRPPAGAFDAQPLSRVAGPGRGRGLANPRISHDLLARRLVKEEQPGGLWDRQENHFLVFDSDGTREAARQRALPKTGDRPAPSRRLRPLCAPGYTGRKRGEVVRTRSTVLQAHTHQWLGSFGNPGNGHYREELRRAVAAIQCYLQAHQLPQERALVRLDGQYGMGAVLADLAGFSFVTRGKDYTVLDRAEIQSRLHLPADQQFSRQESDLVRTLYDCPDVAVGPHGQRCRVVVATHPAAEKKSRVGLTRAGLVYELFFTNLREARFHGCRCGRPLLASRGL